jgi:hypothetical protein
MLLECRHYAIWPPETHLISSRMLAGNDLSTLATPNRAYDEISPAALIAFAFGWPLVAFIAGNNLQAIHILS